MNQRQLECFIATARCRSLSQAAQELFLTQPGVTYQINSLEKELGEPLFDRTTNGMRLNDAGRAFMPTAEKIVTTMATATAQFKSRRPSGRNVIRALHCVDINDCLWRDALAEYARQVPQVEVLTTCSLYKDEFDFLPADVYIVARKRNETHYPPYTTHEPLWQAWTHAIVPADSELAKRPSVTLDDLKPYPVMLPTREYMDRVDCWYWEPLTRNPGEFNLEFHPSWRCSHEAQLSMFNYGGVYISHGPHLNLARDLARVPFAPGTPRIDVMLCALTDETKGPVSAFVRFLRDFYREHASAFDPVYQS